MDNMQWLNAPAEWNIISNSSLSMQVTPKTDYWRKTQYGFTVDDGPFYYSQVGGEFEVSVKITGDYNSRYDQMGIMIRKDENTWVKTGVEYVNDKINLSVVVTHEHSDWSMIEMPEKPPHVHLKVIRRSDALQIMYSLDGEQYVMMRLAHFPQNTTAKVGLMAASPDGNGFHALFEEFRIKHLPDQRRSEWLEQNS